MPGSMQSPVSTLLHSASALAVSVETVEILGLRSAPGSCAHSLQVRVNYCLLAGVFPILALSVPRPFLPCLIFRLLLSPPCLWPD